MGLGLCSVFQGHTYALVEAVWDTFCPLSESCSVGRRVFTWGSSARYKVEEEELAENWKTEIHPLPRFVFLGQLQSWAFCRGGMAMTDVCRKVIWSSRSFQGKEAISSNLSWAWSSSIYRRVCSMYKAGPNSHAGFPAYCLLSVLWTQTWMSHRSMQ